MAWSFEFKAGLGWAVLVLVLMIIALWAEIVTGSILPLLIPIVGYLGFVGWVFRLKK